MAAAFAAASTGPALAADAEKSHAGRIEALSANDTSNPGRVGTTTARLRHCLQENAAIIKSAVSLRAALAGIEDIEGRERPAMRLASDVRRFNWELLEALELDNMLLVGRLHCEAALLREESRGAHNRLDFPDTDDDCWRVRLVCRAGRDRADFRRESLGVAAA